MTRLRRRRWADWLEVAGELLAAIVDALLP